MSLDGGMVKLFAYPEGNQKKLARNSKLIAVVHLTTRNTAKQNTKPLQPKHMLQ